MGSDTLVAFHGSKIKLPQGFIEFSEEQLTTFKSTIFDRQLMAAYEKKDDRTGLKRIIIYYDSLSGTKNLTFEKIVEIKLEVTKESGITFEDIKIDESNHCVYGRTIILRDTSIFGFTIDEFGIMGIQFDNSNGISIKDKENFENLITSIKHGSPYLYLPEENQKVEEVKKEMEHSGLLMTVALVAMILIWLIRKYAIRNK
ncbi:MAG: hypothetical protein COA32_09455 [Fluviicola sp.]|nr:MAG: hypothetical protein COA32_09455 [Fluviicola sp.]